MSNSEFGIQSWMMMKMTKRRGKCKRNKEKGQREKKERRKRVLVRMKLRLVPSLREATTVLTATKGTTVQTRTRGYDGNGGYAGYDGTECNEERYEW